MDEPVPATPRHACTGFRANFRKPETVVSMSSKTLRPEVEIILKRVMTTQSSKLGTSSAHTSEDSRRLGELDPETAHVFCALLLTVDELVVFLLRFFAGFFFSKEVCKKIRVQPPKTV